MDLETYDMRDLKSVFDVILIDPPLEEYQRRCPGRTFNWRPWDWDEVIASSFIRACFVVDQFRVRSASGLANNLNLLRYLLQPAAIPY